MLVSRSGEFIPEVGSAGLWERRRRGRRIELRVRLARRAGKAIRAELELEAERVGAFLGLEPELGVEPG